MLPNSNDLPASLRKTPIGVPVSSLVRFELLAPELGVVLGPGRMLWAPMPEAAIDEDRHPCRPEDDVRTTSNVGQHGPVDAVTKAGGVQGAPQPDLSRGVPSPRPRHALTDRLGRGTESRRIGTAEGLFGLRYAALRLS